MNSLEIAQKTVPFPIKKIAEELGLDESDLECYGSFKAKISFKALERINENKKGKLVLFTSITPTPAGEGKTTCSIGLAQSLRKIGKKSMICLREPSMGPVFGIKGGATGGGYSQILPMEDINLEFTGDIPAISSANNLLSALIDNHISNGNELNIDIEKITWTRCLDMNDRALRNIVTCSDSKGCSKINTGFVITAASEVMAVLCLSENILDLKERLGKIVIGYSKIGEPITVKQLHAVGAMAVILRHAIKPNLVQSIEHCPAFIHGGPFANIAHGTNSIIATKLALSLSDYIITEAGFGSDLGCEKYFDIVCRSTGLKPNAVVIVASVRALRMHGFSEDYSVPDLLAVEKGFSNLEKHIEGTKQFGVPVVVAINCFDSDSKEEIELIKKKCSLIGVNAIKTEFYSMGGDGGKELAKKIVELCEKESSVEYLYSLDESIKTKIENIARKNYGASGVTYSIEAEESIKNLKKNGFGKLPICISKTQKSFSDNPKLIGRPINFTINIRAVHVSAGAGFIVAQSGSLIAMPGLSKEPAAEKITIDEQNNVNGLF